MKPWYLSKTLWTNLILGTLGVLFPSLVKPELVAALLATVNIVLRFISKDEIGLF